MMHNMWQLCRWAWEAARGVRLRVVTIALLGLMRVAASLGFVWVSKMLIDTAVAPDSTSRQIWGLAIALTSLMLAESAFSQADNYMGTITSTRMTNNLRRRIYSSLLSAEVYADRRHSGDMLNRLTIDINTVVSTIVTNLPSIIIMSVQLVAAFWLLCLMNSSLAICALIIMPICIVASKVYVMKMRRVTASIREGESHIHSNMQEGLQHRIVVQTLECAPEMGRRLDRLQDTLMGNNVKRARISLFSRSAVRLGFIAGYLIAFIWSVVELHDGIITFGMMTAFLQLVGRIQMPLSSLSHSLPNLTTTATAIDRLIELEVGKEDRIYSVHTRRGTPATAAPPLGGRGGSGVRLEDVTFAYADDSAPILSHFSYDFRPGSKSVIMGETGVGKSTLTKLILALLHPSDGKVLIYDADNAQEASAATRSLMAYVPQGNSLIEGTIRENLLLADPDATEQQMADALYTAVASFVFDLPLGLDTRCGELGSMLSEGQCQRIAIARALLRKSSILILDEFNSSLDVPTASTLMQRLMAQRPHSTIIFISHRPEVAADASAQILHLSKVLQWGQDIL